MKMFKKSSAAAIVLAASLFASNAQAAQSLIISGSSGTFGDDAVNCAVTGPCAFEREFTFETPVGFNISSLTIESIATSDETDIDFSTVTFNGISFNTVEVGLSESRNLFSQVLQPNGLNRLFVSGTTGGAAAFSGNLSFAAAVPEPTTWMLMLLGFGAIGFSLRRKKESAPRVQFA